jgi:hypothetical protein
MVKRSNRHRENPFMTVYLEYGTAIGIWCANSPLWPGINACHLQRPDIRAQSSQLTEDSLFANEEESIYGHSVSGYCTQQADTITERCILPIPDYLHRIEILGRNSACAAPRYDGMKLYPLIGCNPPTTFSNSLPQDIHPLIR